MEYFYTMFLIVQFGSKKTPKIRECIISCGEEVEVVDWMSALVRPENLNGIIFSGSPTFLTEVDHAPYHQRISPLLDWGVPVLGICFGHQLLGILHGAQIFRGTEIVGPEKIRMLKEDSLLKDLGTEFEMGEDHTEGIDVPKGFYHLATSDSFPVEAIKHVQKDMWGVQFHPEVSGENGMILFRNFIEICGRP
jgi:GMP synthase (glutamine-hydrolysing)